MLCKVRTPDKSVAAIQLEAAANAILASYLILRLIKIVLPVPPGASKKRIPLSFPSTREQNSHTHGAGLL